MIVTCPKCSSRFLLSAQTLGEEGKKVRCSRCKNVWQQEPDEEALAELQAKVDADTYAVSVDADGDLIEGIQGITEIEEEDHGNALTESGSDDLESEDERMFEQLLEERGQLDDMDDDIPSAIKPHQDAELDFVEASDNHPLKAVLGFFLGESIPQKARIGGYGLAILLIFSIFLYVFASQDAYVREKPFMVGFYKIFGLDPDPPGKGLIFDDITAEIEGARLKVKGQIINLYKDDQTVPVIIARILDKQGRKLQEHILDVGADQIRQGDILAFSEDYNAARLKGGETFSIFFKLPRPGDEPKPVETAVKKQESK